MIVCPGGGASGSMMLEDLMDKLHFRGKPKIVDLTSQRKLADKVRSLALYTETHAKAVREKHVLHLSPLVAQASV